LRCPYKGLIPYGEEDARIFFGREDWCTIILNNLLASPLTLLYGPSGVGKSSVLLAGVANRLKDQARRGLATHGQPEWVVIVCRDWRDDPLATLRREIGAAVADLIGRPVAGEMELAGDLTSLLKICGQAIARAHSGGAVSPGKLLLILDQFEEYFLYHPLENGPGTFAEEFPRAVNDPELSLNVLISLRDDSLAKLDRFKKQLPDLFANRLQIDHLNRSAAIDAIRKPIEEFNRQLPADSRKASVEPQLIQDVLEQVKVGQIDATGEEGTSEQASARPPGEEETLRVETPFLQLVMTRLWEEESRLEVPPRLRRDTLTRLGGAGTIVREHLERLMERLPEASKRVAAVIFDKLVTSGLTKIAYPVFELTDPAKVDRPADLLNRQDLKELLDQLSGGSQRILRRLPPALEQPRAEERYEIFHDVLAKPILEWRRRYRQHAEMEGERQRHAEELAKERQRLRRNLWISAGLGLPLLAYSAWLLWTNQRLQAKQRELTVIESAQQFKVQQLDQLDALARALEAAHWLKRRGADNSPEAARDIGAHLRHILDHMRERFKAQLLTEEERQTNPPWISKLHADAGEVGILFRDGGLDIRDGRGGSRRLPPDRDGRGTGTIKAFAFADGGGSIATLSKAPSPGDAWLTRVWGETGRELWSGAKAFSGSGSSGPFLMRHRLALSPDGRRLATASFDGWLRIIELPSTPGGPQPPPIQRRMSKVSLVRFSPDGQRLVAADGLGRVRLLDPATGSAVEGPIQLPQTAGFIFSLDISPQGDRLAIASRDGAVRVYDPRRMGDAGGGPRQQIKTGRIFQLRFSPDGRLLATGSRDGTAEVLDLEAPPAQRSLARFLNQAAVVDLRFSADGRELITMSAAGTLHKWEVPTGARGGGPPAGRQVSAFTFSPGGQALAWSVVGSESVCRLPLAAVRLSDSADVPLPATACELSLRPSGALEKPQPTDLAKLRFNGDGSTLLGLAWDGSGALWDRGGRRLGSLRLPKTVFPPFSGINDSPDGRTVAFVARGEALGELLTCDLSALHNGSFPCVVATPPPPPNERPLDLTSVHFARRARAGDPSLVLSVADGRLCFATLQRGRGVKLDRCQKIPSGQGELAMSPDDAWIGLAGSDGALYLWERKGSTYRLQAPPLKVSAGPLIRATFRPSPDPRRGVLAAMSLDGTASLWTLNGRQLATFRGPGGERGGYLGAEFEPGGDLLLWTLNGSLRQEPVQGLQQLIDRGCAWLREYRQGALTPKEERDRLRFCDASPGG
jgi:WD40 repeat protein